MIRDDRAQTTFEYLLLVGGVVVLALVVTYLLTQSAQSAGQTVQETTKGVVTELNKKAFNVLDKINP